MAAVKIIIIVQIIFSGSLGSLNLFRIIMKIELCLSMCKGESAISIYLVFSLLPKDLTIQNLFACKECCRITLKSSRKYFY